MVRYYGPTSEPMLWGIPDLLWQDGPPWLLPKRARGTPGRPPAPLRGISAPWVSGTG